LSFFASSLEITPSLFLSSDSKVIGATDEDEEVEPVPDAPDPVEPVPAAPDPDEPVPDEPEPVELDAFGSEPDAAPEPLESELEPALEPELEEPAPEEPDDPLCAAATPANKHAMTMDNILSFMITSNIQ
jgi:hypothetical protein